MGKTAGAWSRPLDTEPCRRLAAHPSSDRTIERIFDILARTVFPSEDDLRTGASLTGARGAYRDASEVRREFSDCWLGLLRRLPSRRVRKFLVCLEGKILHHLSRPELLAPGLEAILDQGGLNGVLAMDAIFALMRSYNLDFANFYDRLYGMVTYDTLHSPYKASFMRSCQLFLSSTMVPAYVVAGFCKRLSQLALSSSPVVVAWIVSFIYNLLRQHPACRVLLHREHDDQRDPFLREERSLVGCRAIDSSLWELKSLEAHYWSRISKLVGLFREGFQRPPFDVDSIADEAEEFHAGLAVREELAHRWSRRPPTHCVIEDKLFCD